MMGMELLAELERLARQRMPKWLAEDGRGNPEYHTIAIRHKAAFDPIPVEILHGIVTELIAAPERPVSMPAIIAACREKRANSLAGPTRTLTEELMARTPEEKAADIKRFDIWRDGLRRMMESRYRPYSADWCNEFLGILKEMGMGATPEGQKAMDEFRAYCESQEKARGAECQTH